MTAWLTRLLERINRALFGPLDDYTCDKPPTPTPVMIDWEAERDQP